MLAEFCNLSSKGSLIKNNHEISEIWSDFVITIFYLLVMDHLQLSSLVYHNNVNDLFATMKAEVSVPFHLNIFHLWIAALVFSSSAKLLQCLLESLQPCQHCNRLLYRKSQRQRSLRWQRRDTCSRLLPSLWGFALWWFWGFHSWQYQWYVQYIPSQVIQNLKEPIMTTKPLTMQYQT